MRSNESRRCSWASHNILIRHSEHGPAVDKSVVLVFFLPEVEHNWAVYFHRGANEVIGATWEALQIIARLLFLDWSCVIFREHD